MYRKILLAAVIAASFGAAPLVASAQPVGVIVDRAPPPPREEPMPHARRGHEWAPGHWAWRHGEYVWVRGHWMGERRGMRWVPERWVERDGRWELQAGHWARRGDRDGDGIPNRFDRRPNNPNRG
jgi:hypothetical protein